MQQGFCYRAEEQTGHIGSGEAEVGNPLSSYCVPGRSGPLVIRVYLLGLGTGPQQQRKFRRGRPVGSTLYRNRGEREGWLRCSTAEHGMRLGDWIW